MSRQKLTRLWRICDLTSTIEYLADRFSFSFFFTLCCCTDVQTEREIYMCDPKELRQWTEVAEYPMNQQTKEKRKKRITI